MHFRNRAQLVVAALVTCLHSAVFAQDTAQPPGREFGAPDPFASETLLRLFAGLFVVLVFVFVVIWLLKRLQQLPVGDNRVLRSLGTLAVGQRERVVLIQVGEEQFVIGVTPGRIDCLHRLEQPVADAARQVEDGSFAAKLKGVLGGEGSA